MSRESTGIRITGMDEYSDSPRGILVRVIGAPLVRIQTEGDTDVLLSPEQARELAKHLVAHADEADAKAREVEVV